MDGLVTYVANLEPGDSVSTYTSLVKIANSDSLRITFSTNDYHELTVGTELDISYTGKNGFTTIGRVVQLPTDVPVTSPDSERTAVKVEVDEKPDDASIGTSVNISLLLERKEGCIVLPIRYVSTYSSRRYVRILNDDGIPEERDVKLGIQNVSEVEIVSGLEAGDVIVI